MLDKEKRIKDERLLEATRKGLTGLDGKFAIILKNLGLPILATGGSCYESRPFLDVYALEDEEAMPTEDEDATTTEIGYIFDGLRNGINLEIKYTTEKLEVHYNGHLVYCEITGELECYVPSKEWESKVDMFFNQAKIKENKGREARKDGNKQELQRQKLALLDKLRTKWGL